MITQPKLCSNTTTIAGAREHFADDHVHALLIVEHGILLAVVERDDLLACPANTPARHVGKLGGRTVAPGADLEHTRRLMIQHERRRLAVVDSHNRLLGLLCLKRSQQGFCSNTGVRARAEEHSELCGRR